MNKQVKEQYERARAAYAALGVDTDEAIEKLQRRAVSLHCWQGDDIAGFEGYAGASQNVVTGNAPGRATTPAELRKDLEEALSLAPGKHKVNLHANYAEVIDCGRDAYTVKQFQKWIDWAKQNHAGLDFNSTFFAHEKMDRDLSLASPNADTREFWVRHAVSCRKIASEIGKALGEKCVHNIWIPDGLKDTPADRASYRALLQDSLDKIFAEKLPAEYSVDALEGKLFGIGTESFVVGSYDFYLGYALKHNVGITLDTGHFHPTESVADKLSALALFSDNILLHVSRGVRWDSDHAVIFNDELRAVMRETVQNEARANIYIGLDYFDASINRIFAWGVGLRAAEKALLEAYLEPVALVKQAEEQWDFGRRLALFEEFKSLPLTAVWDYACEKSGAPVGMDFLRETERYAADVLAKRRA